MDVLKTFKANWRDKQFATPQQTVLLAVSGGSDSMGMAHLCLHSGLSFALAHCNFQLRGYEADADEALVRNWAFDNNIVFHHTRFDTKERMAEWKKGVQETARILRYEWLEQMRLNHGYSNIATAHHANDNVETVLMNLFKGTGMAGLHGIPVKNDKIIRPLMFASKNDITDYIALHNVPYREDASNASDNYLRNEVRHHIVPAVEKIFPNGVQHLNDSITRFAEAELIYNKAIAQERKKLVEKRGQDYYVPILKLQLREPLHTLCYELFKPFGYTSSQVQQLVKLLSSESGHYVDSATHRVLRNRSFLIVTTLKTEEAGLLQIESLPCMVKTAHHNIHFSTGKPPDSIPQGNTVAYVDAANITMPLILRKWKTGDYFYPLGMGMKKKKLSRYFIDQKVPLHDKEKVWVLESNKRIVWVCGMRLDERFKVKDKTEMVYCIELRSH